MVAHHQDLPPYRELQMVKHKSDSSSKQSSSGSESKQSSDVSNAKSGKDAESHTKAKTDKGAGGGAKQGRKH
jgi:hypothetical protein